MTQSHQSCPHLREPVASLMAAEPSSSSGLMCTRIFTWWSSKRKGLIPNQRSASERKPFSIGVAKLKKEGAEVHAVYEACGFGFGLQRQLSALGIRCQVVCPQKLDERNKRVKTDGLDAKALCLKLDRFIQGNREALPWFGYRHKRKNKSAPSIASGNNWLKPANNWKPWDAV